MRPLLTTDELDLYLISQRLKQACSIGFTSKEHYYTILSAKFKFVRLQPTDPIISVLHMLNGTQWSLELQVVTARWKPKEPAFAKEFGGINAGLDAASHQKLLDALETDSDYEKGIALGIPTEAATYFCTGGAPLAGAEHLLRMKERGEGLPMWLAYTPFIPEPDAYTNPNSPSRLLADKYMECVRRNNPSLARRCEKFFQDVHWGRLEDTVACFREGKGLCIPASLLDI